MTSRREFLTVAGASGLAASVSPQATAETLLKSTTLATKIKNPTRHSPVRTLNGWTLPYTMNNGVKEFHLVAEEIEHEFAPGSVAKCWGYNGSTPGPTIEAIEGDHVAFLSLITYKSTPPFIGTDYYSLVAWMEWAV